MYRMKVTFHDRKGSCIVTLFTGESARTVTEETMGNITGGTKKKIMYVEREIDHYGLYEGVEDALKSLNAELVISLDPEKVSECDGFLYRAVFRTSIGLVWGRKSGKYEP